MAINAPFGFKPYSNLAGAPWNQNTIEREIKPVLVGGTPTAAIFQGDPVKVDRAAGNEGYIIPSTGDVILGIFQGCQFIDASGNVQYKNYWPSVPVAANTLVKAFIVADPNVIFNVQTGATGGNLINFDQNYPYLAAAGDTATGVSKYTLNLAGVSNTTATFKVIGVSTIIGNVVGETFNQVSVLINNSLYKAPTANAV